MLLDRCVEEGYLLGEAKSPYTLPGLLLAGVEVSEEDLRGINGDITVNVRDLVTRLAYLGRLEEAKRVISAVASRGEKVALLAAVGRVMDEQGFPRDEVDGAFDEAIAQLVQLPRRGQVRLLPIIARELSSYNVNWAIHLAEEALRHTDWIIRPEEQVTVEGAARTLLAELDPFMVHSTIDDLLAKANATRPTRDAVTTESALSFLEEHCYSAVVAENRTVSDLVLMESRSRSNEDTGIYWNAWAMRLAGEGSVTDAEIVVRDPHFGSAICQRSGVVGLTMSLLMGTEVEPEWSRIQGTVGALHAEMFALESILLRFWRGESTFETSHAFIESLDGPYEKLLGSACLESLRDLKVGSISESLRSLSRAYTFYSRDSSESVSFTQAEARLQALPRAICNALTNRFGIEDIQRTIEIGKSEGSMSGVGASVFAARLLPMARDFTEVQIGRLAEVARGAERDIVITGYELLAARDPDVVASWLCSGRADDLNLDPSWELGAWSSVAIVVLENVAMSPEYRLRLAAESRARLSALDFGAERASEIELAVQVAPVGLHRGREFLEQSLSPLVVGPALCMLASSRASSSSEWRSVFLEGLELTRPGRYQSVVNFSFTAGQALTAVGDERLREVISDGALEMWPGHVVGAAYGLAGMIAGFCRSDRAEEVLNVLEMVRESGRFVKEI
jgi:hypothetical protein